MASALLVSRNEPSWCRKEAYMTKHSTSAARFNFPKFHPNPNPIPNPGTQQIYNAGRTIHSRDVAGDDRLSYPCDPTRKLSCSADSKVLSHRVAVSFKLAALSRSQLEDLKRRLILELEQVRSLRNRIESGDIGTRPVCPPPKVNGTKRKGFVGRPANPFNPAKGANLKRRVGRPPRKGRVVDGLMKQCAQILQKLMKHQFGWVFNKPVDAKRLGLHDYHRIIKTPMDLGTVKSRLRKEIYSSPLEFAADVRLTFNNALTYNPKGDDANTMAEALLTEFEEMFKPVCKTFEVEQRHVMVESLQEQDPVVIEDCTREGYGPVSLPGSEIKMADEGRKLLKPQGMNMREREMSFEEKQQLGRSLEDLPAEKMTQMVEILRQRNGYLANDDDEIEVDIDALDNETIWELERFVTCHKMASESRCQESLQNSVSLTLAHEELRNETVVAAQRCNKAEIAGGEEDVDIGEEIPVGNYPPVEIERDDANIGNAAVVASSSKSGSSSSSSSGSGSSSSSGSDSGSSSDKDSDADSVQSPFVG